MLHLTIRAEAREPAMLHLRGAGSAPRLNGVGIIVPVPPDQKAAPFRLLSEARIAVEDFELIAVAGAPAAAAQEVRS